MEVARRYLELECVNVDHSFTRRLVDIVLLLRKLSAVV